MEQEFWRIHIVRIAMILDTRNCMLMWSVDSKSTRPGSESRVGAECPVIVQRVQSPRSRHRSTTTSVTLYPGQHCVNCSSQYTSSIVRPPYSASEDCVSRAAECWQGPRRQKQKLFVLCWWVRRGRCVVCSVDTRVFTLMTIWVCSVFVKSLRTLVWRSNV